MAKQDSIPADLPLLLSSPGSSSLSKYESEIEDINVSLYKVCHGTQEMLTSAPFLHTWPEIRQSFIMALTHLPGDEMTSDDAPRTTQRTLRKDFTKDFKKDFKRCTTRVCLTQMHQVHS